MQWGHDADAKLFMHVLKIHNVKLDYNALALAMGNDVTPKALTHRIAKLRSMAEDASSSTPPTPGSTPGLPLPQPAKRTPRPTPSPAGNKNKNKNNNNKKKVAAANNSKANDKTPVVAGTKRTATGTVKNEPANESSPLLHGTVLAAAAAAGDGGEEEEEEEEVALGTPSKKAKVVNNKAAVAVRGKGARALKKEMGEGDGCA